MSIKKLSALLLVLILILSSFAGCKSSVDVDKSGTADLQNYPVTVNEVTIDSKPSSVVCLSASLADAILAMGYETSLKAVSEDATQDDFSTLTKVNASDVDAVTALSPDVVIAESFSDDMSAKLTEAGVKYVAISASSSRSDFERLYTQLGSVLEGANTGYKKGQETAESIFTSLDDLSRIIPESKTILTACYLYDDESKAATGDTLISTVFEYAGLTNIFKGSENGTFDFENLKIGNPDYIFCDTGVKDKIMSSENFASLKAVTNGNVYEIPSNEIEWQGRTVITTATNIAAVAYPSLTKETSTSVEYSGAESSEESSSESSKEESSKEESSKDESSKEESSKEESSKAESSEESSEATLEDTEGLQAGLDNDYSKVIEVQEKLAELGYLDNSYDGFFGDATEEAVKAFQKANGIKDNGVVGENTLNALNSDNAVKAK